MVGAGARVGLAVGEIFLQPARITAVQADIKTKAGSIFVIRMEMKRRPCGRLLDQPFTPPAVSPLTICFCRRTYTIATGAATMIDMAANRFQGMELAYCPTML